MRGTLRAGLCPAERLSPHAPKHAMRLDEFVRSLCTCRQPEMKSGTRLAPGTQPYWLRVRRHQREGDSKRYGYFAGVALDPKQPLVWLVAPGLRFHSATETLLKYLSPETQVTRIGLNENWRRKLKVVFRQ
jgi:hypothetical protein